QGPGERRMVDSGCGEGIGGRLDDASAAESRPHSSTTEAADPRTLGAASRGYRGVVQISEDHGAAAVADCDGLLVAEVCDHLTDAACDSCPGADAAADIHTPNPAAPRGSAQRDPHAIGAWNSTGARHLRARA